MTYKIKNNAAATLAVGMNTTDTTLQVAPGKGDLFPVISGADHTRITLENASGDIEVMKITARASGSDSMTVQRAQEGTTAKTWLIGDIVELRISAGVIEDIQSEASAAVAAHEAAADPHPQYLTATEGAAAYQPKNDNLTAESGLAGAADKLPYYTGPGVKALTTLSAFGRSLIDDADAAAARDTLGAMAKAGGAFSGGVKEAKAALPANDIDVDAGNYFTKTITEATTLTVSNIPASGAVASFILDLTNGGSAVIAWWAGMKWSGGTAPTLTAAGRDVLGFFTLDGGVTWTGLVLGKDVK